MKLLQLANASQAIQKIANQDLSMKTLHRLSRQLDAIRPHLEFYDAKRTEILEKHCQKDEKGYLINDSNREVVETELQELFEVEAEDIKAVEIPEYENLKLSYADFKALEGIITIKFEEE